MAGSNAAKTRKSIWETCLVNSWIWLGIISYCFWVAVVNHIDTTDFYSIFHCSKDQEFVDWSNNAWWIKWTKFYCYLLWVDLLVTEG